MKTLFRVLFYLLVPSWIMAQQGQEVMKRSYEKCQSIQNGCYEMKELMKFMTGKDTSQVTFRTCFKKLSDDTLSPVAFHTRTYFNDTLAYEVLYTGREMVRPNWRDSTANIMNVEMWADDIKAIRSGMNFYAPFTSRRSSPLPDQEALNDSTNSYVMLKDEVLDGRNCYHVQMNQQPEEAGDNRLQALRIEFHFWIDKQDFIPLQYTIAYDLVMNNDTMFQYQKFILGDYNLNDQEDNPELTLASIPGYMKFKEHVAYHEPDPLPLDTIAPGWSLMTTDSVEVRLEDLHGKLVLIDFFYRSCYPCMQALPGLQRISETFTDRDVVVIGIDPFDTPEELQPFLSKRGITYTVLVGGRDVATQYRVSGYPTMYLIDRDGKIVFLQVGYGEGVDETLEEAIREQL